MQCQSITKSKKRCTKYSNGKTCHIHSFNNCGKNRKRLKIYDTSVKKIISLTCDYLPLTEVSSILGPATYNEWTVGDGKVIGIFGEYHIIPLESVKHINKQSTLIFPNFLKALLATNKTIQYDLFIEKAYVYDEDMDDDEVDPAATIFNILSIDFKSCLTFVKNCKYTNLRAHYIDYGRTSDEWFNHMYNDIYFGTKGIRNYIQLSTMREEYDKRFSDVLEFIRTDTKIAKQLSPTTNSIRNSIRNYIEGSLLITKLKFLLFLEGNDIETVTMMSLKIKTYKDFTKRFAKNEDSVDMHEYKTELVMRLIKLYTHIMDIYALGRLFRSFKKNGTKSFSNNSIVYVGQDHAILYNNFMAYMKYDHIIKIGDDNIDTYTVPFSKSNKRKSFLFI